MMTQTTANQFVVLSHTDHVLSTALSFQSIACTESDQTPIQIEGEDTKIDLRLITFAHKPLRCTRRVS
jgi:hypothetical protein